ncbi:hemerythrin domain-containing protein [Alicycliphilus denitrificans]|uniref:hemerythrin domain-containing protein n=1 Tax=Alicycliphilus denitrificans TaxID=179636 RepID=UPI003850B068
MTTTAPPAYFERQHERLDAQLQAHLLDVAGADFGSALERLEHWRRDLDRHTEIENTLLLPHVPPGARWAARVYLLEHERIGLLADEYEQRVRAVVAQPPQGELARRRAVLLLLDAAHALRHVLEHHNEREHQALAHELPLELQKTAWAGE